MLILLDTHLVIWALVGDSRLSASAAKQISDPGNVVYVSTVSIWEIAIKHALKRKRDPIPFSGTGALVHCRDAGFRLLDIRPEHAAAVEELPPLHADPFDRLLLAQARVEPMHLMTSDGKIAAYGAGVLRV